AAATFWGLHSVAGWITYDITFLSEFLLVFFVLASLILAVDGHTQKSPARICGSIVLFIAALLTKEAAITYPLSLLICLGLAGLRDSAASTTARKVRDCFKKALPLTGLSLILSSIHAGVLLHWLRAGLLYTQGESSPYNINP